MNITLSRNYVTLLYILDSTDNGYTIFMFDFIVTRFPHYNMLYIRSHRIYSSRVRVLHITTNNE